MKLSRAESEERRADVVAHRGMVVEAYGSGRSLRQLASDWEVEEGWLEDQLRGWQVPLRGVLQVAVLVVDATGRVLLVEPAAGGGVPGLRLPGGWTRKDELITLGAGRELRRETGLVRAVPQLVAAWLDSVPGRPATRRLVFLGAPLTAAESRALADLPQATLVPLPDLPHHTHPRTAHHIHTALTHQPLPTPGHAGAA